ncbi:MAG: BREX system P-loop protein BrxC, partial [Blastocatellia bacterium]
MTLKSIFNRPVDRPIEGVIKADDEASLRLEIEEYVLTHEVEKRLESFLDAYNNYQGANGVWISGFFGSGKSHLLKMLALLLENRQIDGVPALDLFLPKCVNGEILRADLKKAVTIPSKSILFNIDQKADVISKTQIDALLAVFVKVFDEMCGYYGKQGHIAQFERDLDSRLLYDSFKSAYQSIAGRPWHKGREQALLEAKNIAKAYAQATGDDETSTLGILDKYRNQYRVSIEDFAEQVHAYIEQQSPNFRLNFFVDEVGQYIAENVKLMTNLQTIAESLATRCRGRAWVIVTAQEDMGMVVGEMGKQQGNDFSKIQARFATRMKLTSADVAEVIQKRLLTKTEEGVYQLTDLHHAQSNNFKTLFDFADGSQTYRNFNDRDHFIHSYPFIPYQFALFQSAIQNLSAHNAFEGKHSSVGERSMLGVFQQVAIKIGDYQIGRLATFDLMFEGIRTALKSNIQRAIIQAEHHLEGPFAIQLLKTLFLVKYIKEFKPTVRNLCVLMYGGFNQDLPSLKKQVEEALALLEQQTYVQRNGELYEFLTDEEKDVEQEIRNTEVESADVAAELEKIVFDLVIKFRKIRHQEIGQDYPFSRKLDDRLHGREYELAIHVISPFHDQAENETILQMQSMGRDELLILIPADERLIRDLLTYKRTEKYIRQNISTTQNEGVKRILADKGHQNQERYAELQRRVQMLIGKAKLFVAGNKIEIGSGDAQTRVLQGFHELVTRTYPNLRMLRGINYTENDIAQCLQHSHQGLFGNNVNSLSESEQELLAFIQSNSRGGVRTTLKYLIEKFERKPYGWYFSAILCTLAKLCARGKVEVRTDGNLLELDELEQVLPNTHAHGNVVLDPQVEFTASQVRALKEFFEDFFDASPTTSEAKLLGKETGTAFQELLDRLHRLTIQASQYPFLLALSPVIEKIKELPGKPYTWYLTELTRQEDALIAMKENIIDPISKFMKGPQKDIFDTTRNFVQTQEPNFAYLGEEVGSGKWEVEKPAPGNPSADSLLQILNDPDCFKGNRMQLVKTHVEALQERVNAQIEAEMAKARATVTTLKDRLCAMAEFKALNADQKEQLTRPFAEFNATIERQKLIAVIRDSLRRFEENQYPQLLGQLSVKCEVGSGKWEVENGRPDATKPGTIAEKPAHYPLVTIHSLKVPFNTAWLADETDVERYLESMRKTLLDEIGKG